MKGDGSCEVRFALECLISSFDRLDQDLWRQLQDNSALCDIFQTLEWAEVLRHASEGDPNFLLIMQGSKIVGGCLVSLPRFPLIPLRTMTIRGGPFYLPSYETLVIDSLIRFTRKKKDVLFNLIQPSAQVNAKFRKTLVNEGFKIDRNNTFLIDLTRTETELWNRLNKRARWGVRKAERSNVKVSEATYEQDWNDFYRLHEFHCLKHGYSSLLSASLFKKIHEILYSQGMAKLFLAKLDSKIIAGTLILIHRKCAVFFRNASLTDYMEFEPNNILQWASIKWAKEHQLDIYDMGGIVIPESRASYLYGLYKYKEKWGGELVDNSLYYQGNIYGMLTRSLFRSDRGKRLYNLLQRTFVRVAGMSG